MCIFYHYNSVKNALLICTNYIFTFCYIFDRSYQRVSNLLVLLALIFRSISYFLLIRLDNLDLLSGFLKIKRENLTLYRLPFCGLPLDSFRRNLCGSFSIKNSFIFVTLELKEPFHVLAGIYWLTS